MILQEVCVLLSSKGGLCGPPQIQVSVGGSAALRDEQRPKPPTRLRHLPFDVVKCVCIMRAAHTRDI